MDNKYSVYRQIRFNRTYRTLGKMTWWRVVLGAVLLASVFLISGVVSQYFASRGNFHLAEKLMVSPQWMEKHKPETKAFIEAGVFYQDGDFEAASDAFADIKDMDAAPIMKQSADIKLALQLIESQEFDLAYDIFSSLDVDLIAEDRVEDCNKLSEALFNYCEGQTDSEASARVEYISGMMSLLNEK